jgi:FkbM family methyltransferase
MGIWFKLDAWYRANRYRRRRDYAEMRAMEAHLPRGGFAIDIGGFKGGYTWWMRKYVGNTGRVLTFEPQPHLCDRLKRMVREYGWRNVEIEQMGLSSAPGQFSLYRSRDPVHAGQATLRKPADGDIKDVERIDIAVETLDGHLARKNLTGVNFIKMDAEGHEFEIFKGGEQSILRDHPVLLFECYERFMPGIPKVMFAWLEERGYTGAWFFNRKLAPISDWDPAVHQHPSLRHSFDNFLFVPKDRAGA